MIRDILLGKNFLLAIIEEKQFKESDANIIDVDTLYKTIIMD